MKKMRIKVLFYHKGPNNLEYTGRFLGIIKRKEFVLLMKNRDLHQRTLSKMSKSISTLSALTNDEVEGTRFVFAVHSKNGVDMGSRKNLLITNEIKLITSIEPAKRRIMAEDTEGTLIEVEETEADG